MDTLKKVAGIAIGLYLGWLLLQWFFDNPQDAATKVNEGADVAGDTAGGLGTFLGALSGGALLFLALIVIAFIISRRK